MPSKSWKQHKFWEFIFHNDEAAKEKGIDKKVAKDFLDADKERGLTKESDFEKKSDKPKR